MTRAEAAWGSASATSTSAGRISRFMSEIEHRAPDGVAGASRHRELLVPIGNPSPVQVVGRELDLHPIAGQDADVVPAHLARDVAEHLVIVVELDLEHRVRESLDYLPLHLDLLFLGHQPRAL